MKLITEVFRSPKRDEMYLYVDRQKGLKPVPESLLAHFGTPESVMTLVLTPDRKLARAEGSEVYNALRTQGYYLQMPPAREDYLLDLYRTPTEARY